MAKRRATLLPIPGQGGAVSALKARGAPTPREPREGFLLRYPNFMEPVVDDPVAAQLVAGTVISQAALEGARTEARKHLLARDALIRQLRSSDPSYWTYARIADAVGLTAKNVVYILSKPE